VRVWERATGKEVQKLTGHYGGVLSVAVTPDGRYIVSGSGDQTVRVWSIDKLK
jgi:WD40 repeat protein